MYSNSGFVHTLHYILQLSNVNTHVLNIAMFVINSAVAGICNITRGGGELYIYSELLCINVIVGINQKSLKG